MLSHQPHSYGSQDQQVLYAPATRENRERLGLEQAMEGVEELMRTNTYDEAIMRWLQAGEKSDEIFKRVLYKYNPVCIAELQPLLLLSVGATITNQFSSTSENIRERINWLEVDIYSFNQMVPALDDQVREVTPKIMTLIKGRIEKLIMEINRTHPQEALLKTLANLAHVAGRIVENVQTRHPALGHPGPAY